MLIMQSSADSRIAALRASFSRSPSSARLRLVIPVCSSLLAAASCAVRSMPRRSMFSLSFLISSSARLPSVISACNLSLSFSSSCGLGRASARGINGTNATAVPTESAAVISLMAPERRYVPCQRVHTSIRCVVPHPRMNAPNIRNIQLKGKSRRLRTK